MKFIIKSIVSTLLAFFGSWLGAFIGLGTSLLLGFILSIVGWYGAKYWLARQDI